MANQKNDQTEKKAEAPKKARTGMTPEQAEKRGLDPVPYGTPEAKAEE
jgi:hypothetical protein